MEVKLLHNSPLWLCSNAIRFSHDNHDKSDTTLGWNSDKCGYCHRELQACEKDKALIHRVGNKMKHKSVLEQLVYWFDIDGISRACLQELARHRTARLTVKSTRYTLKELKELKLPLIEELNAEQLYQAEGAGADITYCPVLEKHYHIDYYNLNKYLVMTDDTSVNICSALALENLRKLIRAGKSNDKAKYALVESFGTKLQWQIDGRNLQSFLELRSSREALWEIRLLARAIFDALPSEHKYLYEEYMKDK